MRDKNLVLKFLFWEVVFQFEEITMLNFVFRSCWLAALWNVSTCLLWFGLLLLILSLIQCFTSSNPALDSHTAALALFNKDTYPLGEGIRLAPLTSFLASIWRIQMMEAVCVCWKQKSPDTSTMIWQFLPSSPLSAVFAESSQENSIPAVLAVWHHEPV